MSSNKENIGYLSPTKAKEPSLPYIVNHNLAENKWISAFLKEASETNSFTRGLNLGWQFHFLWWWPLCLVHLVFISLGTITHAIWKRVRNNTIIETRHVWDKKKNFILVCGHLYQRCSYKRPRRKSLCDVNLLVYYHADHHRCLSCLLDLFHLLLGSFLPPRSNQPFFI